MDRRIQSLLEIPAETLTVEFKRLAGEKVVEKIVETIVAFANTDGGTLVLGIDDPEKTKLKGESRIFGIEENLEIFDAIGRELQRIVPPLADIWPPRKVPVSGTGHTVGLLTVPKAETHFHSINNHVFVRLEKGNKRLSPQEIVKFSYAKGFEQARTLTGVQQRDKMSRLLKKWVTQGLLLRIDSPSKAPKEIKYRLAVLPEPGKT